MKRIGKRLLNGLTAISLISSVSGGYNSKLADVLSRDSIEDEVSFRLFHHADVNGGQDLFPDNHTSVIRSRFDRSLPTKFIIHGWTHGQDAPWVKEMREEMASTKKWNVIVVDWAPMSHTIYSEARIHSRLVGEHLGKLCIFLLNLDYIQLPSLHFIGHSMGAHIAGYASDTIRTQLNEIPDRITGLDPIAPLFERPKLEIPQERLDSNDAHFVDVIHTNGGSLGMMTAIGHVDFYPNGGTQQPGCGSMMCSHERSCEFWTASIKNPCEYRAITYNSWDAYLDGKTKILSKVPMRIGAGAFIPNGLYFLATSEEEPYIIITPARNETERKRVLPEDKYNATNFLTLWDFEGVLKYTPLFYGWYTNQAKYSKIYRLPLAYFMTELVVYVYSFVATLRKMAENSRMSKLSEKDDECIFSWKLFTGWDYMIGNPETAHNRVMSVVTSFKEALLEEAEKKRKERNWKIIWTRVFVNVTIIGLFALSATAVFFAVKRSTEPEATIDVWRRNEITVVMTLISFIFPMILEFLGFMEQYHPRKQLRIQLARIMLLNLLNLYSLIFAQFDKISDMTDDLIKFQPNVTPIPDDLIEFSPSTTAMVGLSQEDNFTNCYTVCFNKTHPTEAFNITEVISFITSSVATTALPKFLSSLSSTTIFSTPTTLFQNDTSITDYYQNETLWENSTMTYFNDTECCGNNTDFNFTIAGNESSQFLFDSFKTTFQDYLRYMLESFTLWNQTEDTESYANTTESLSNTSYTNFTTLWQDDTTYENFKTSLAPIFNATLEDIDERFDTEFSTFYDDISSTIAWTEQTSLQTQPSEVCEERCETVTSSEVHHTSTIPTTTTDMSYVNKTKLRSLCWETMFGQELVKLTVMDFVFTVGGIIGIDFVRGFFVRVMNKCWCWDLEKKFPEYGEFKVAENILHLVNNQGMVWMGMFFSPGLVVINVFKLSILMYLRSWAVLTCNVPHAIIFRASRSNNFYFALLLIMLFLCVLPVGYAIVWVQPSWHCGPFSQNVRIFHVLTRTIRRIVPQSLHRAMDYVVSPGIVIPLLVLLILVIYYLISLTNSLREANADLKIQLRQERTEERRKMFQVANRRRRGGSGGSGEFENTPFAKWKKLLGNLPSGKSTDETSKGAAPSTPQENAANTEVIKTRDIMSKFIRRALRKSSVPSESDSIQIQDDATDNEQPESLPEDINSFKEAKPQVKVGGNKVRNRPEFLPRASTDSNEGKRVQIAETSPEVYRRNSQPRRDTFDLKKKEEWRRRHRNQSPSRSSSSKDTRHDSITSNWSDNIPVITISKTESAECILDENKKKREDNGKTETENKIKDEKDKVEEEVKISSSSDTLAADEQVFKPRIKCVLKKQAEVNEKDDASQSSGRKNEIGEEEETEDESTRTTVKSNVFEKNTTSGTSDTTKTESSADYKEKSLSSADGVA